ncbi:MAG: hypothetical protein Ct9H300mP28_09060 [Pseudomonadota bacterium]|nr:MAG: hypothetical protein Ct9H300mP28_09060 [Pseudomonadota bacterium]
MSAANRNSLSCKHLGFEETWCYPFDFGRSSWKPQGRNHTRTHGFSRSVHRPDSSQNFDFFRKWSSGHVQFGDPVCPKLCEKLVQAAQTVGATIHLGGTYICMEGPAFSSRAESLLYRSWGADVIGMTNAQEAKLAREAEMAFASIALATDYDCWHVSESEVNVEDIIKVMHENVETPAGLLLKPCAIYRLISQILSRMHSNLR